MSTIKIYKTNITPDRNALVDDLATYLSSLVPAYSNDTFQYIQLSTDISIKVELDQEMQAEEIGNYVDLLQDGKHFYFFILKSAWKSTKTIELSLSIDSVNTFKDDFTFNKKTNIIRQHKDRIKENIKHLSDTASTNVGIGTANSGDIVVPELIGATNFTVVSKGFSITPPSQGGGSVGDVSLISETGTIHFTYSSSGTGTAKVTITYKAENNLGYARDIDMVQEGINAPQYHKSSDDTIIKENNTNLNWYLIYKNKNEPSAEIENNPVQCFLCSDEDILVKPSDHKYTAEWYRDKFMERGGVGTKFYLISTENLGSYIEIRNVNHAVLHTIDLSGRKIIRIARDGFLINVVIYTYDTAWNLTGSIAYGDGTYIYFNEVSVGRNGADSTDYWTISEYPVDPEINLPQEGHIKPISQIDRTDNKLIKIIKLPYSPSSFVYDGYLDYDRATWVYNTTESLLQLTDLNIKFDNTFEANVNPFEVLVVNIPEITHTELRDDYYESKLYSSELYVPKFIYDSFNLNFELQNMATVPSEFNVDFTTTSTINSTFMFTFPEYELKYSSQDYDNILIVRRNNEITLYNNAYINYIKTGYNYDVKNKNTQIATSWISAGIQIAGSVLSFLAAGATGGLSAVAAIGLTTSATVTIANNISNDIKAERSIQQKLDEARNQATSVSGSDDIDLLTKYSNNKAKLAIYKASDNVMKHAADLFYYCGYAANRQDIPNTTSRYWFNYIQCEPVFNEEETSIYKNYLDDIKARYNAGITVYHAHNNTYDWGQVYENWEINL